MRVDDTTTAAARPPLVGRPDAGDEIWFQWLRWRLPPAMASGPDGGAARPNDATQARSAMALTARARVWAGVVLRARWARVVSLLTSAGFELRRLDASAASVDPITLSSECETLSVSTQPAGLMP